ncbi:SAM-dependent methyltransferase [Pseudonocardia xinjiangensis]|uniref:SAM-dependent methyltransferase n=1 Tax=Pseudonocardia xinjiangensis TaxID=75289 RepID=UPI003D8F041F
MLVEIRPAARLRGKNAVDLTAALAPVFGALTTETDDAGPVTDLSRLRVVADWVQYRNNFRTPVELRPVVGGGPPELALDLRGISGTGADAVTSGVAAALRAHHSGGTGSRHLTLEEWGPTRDSAIWAFNSLYWQHLQLWEEATGQGYESALPGGQSDARHLEPVRETIGKLFAIWDSLADRRALPEELYVVELGVGNGNQAGTWLDTFVEMDRAHGREYYRRLHYLMCDYSPHVLELARATVCDHAEHVSSFVLDAQRPLTSLAFLRFKVFFVYISNVYDNLPTDEIATIGQREHLVEARAYLPDTDATAIAAGLGIEPETLGALVQKLLRLGPPLLAEAYPQHFADVPAAVQFWRECWQSLKLQERYVPLHGLDTYEIAPGISGELLRPLLATGGDVRMHVSNGAATSFAETLPLLHPYGRLQCHDIVVTDPHQYRSGFRGPGKYDGSVVNWVNGPLLAHIGARKGFDVSFAPFRRNGSNIITMTADVRD